MRADTWWNKYDQKSTFYLRPIIIRRHPSIIWFDGNGHLHHHCWKAWYTLLGTFPISLSFRDNWWSNMVSELRLQKVLGSSLSIYIWSRLHPFFPSLHSFFYACIDDYISTGKTRLHVREDVEKLDIHCWAHFLSS